MSKVIRYLPELMGEEQVHVATLMKELSEEQAEHFARVYRQRRKEDTVTLVMALVGLFGIAGIHRFYLGKTALGILYLFTFGLCGVGTIIDAINFKKLTAQFNMIQADDVAYLIKGAFPDSPKQLEASGDNE